MQKDHSRTELQGPSAAAIDPQETAEAAGLTYVSDEQPGIRRQMRGHGFSYTHADGRAVTDKATLARIRKLAIPPAWTDVWICPKSNGHIQATGRDAKGRKQYKYHPDFRELRESAKYEHILRFAACLPAIRQTIDEHMSARGLGREKVLATVVHLLETTLIRVGNDDYANRNRSYGLTTLRSRHVRIEGPALRFNFKGKGGKTWRLGVKDRRIAKVVRACQELPGQDLFQYFDEQGEVRTVTSSDINAYLREISGQDITAKDFRTWAGTLMAATALRKRHGAGDTPSKKTIKAALEEVAASLGNTPTICRKCYVHPEVLNAYLDGSLDLRTPQRVRQASPLRPDERAVLAFLQARLGRPLP